MEKMFVRNVPLTIGQTFTRLSPQNTECIAVDEYCSKNVGGPRCKCRDLTNTSAECKSYVNIYRAKAVDNIDIDTLAQKEM